MPGAGRLTFSAGQVLTAAQVQDYLQDQAVMNFSGTAARASAIPSPSAGMVSHIGGGTVQVYNGTAWTDIDTPGGLVKIADQSFSAASAVNVNNCFTSTYANYRVIVEFTAMASANISMRYRVSGSDDATANYSNAYSYNLGSTWTLSRTSGQTSALIVPNASIGYGDPHFIADIGGPQLARPTNSALTIASSLTYLHTAQFVSSTQFDGFSIYPASGTISGTLRVYGYRN